MVSAVAEPDCRLHVFAYRMELFAQTALIAWTGPMLLSLPLAWWPSGGSLLLSGLLPHRASMWSPP